MSDLTGGRAPTGPTARAQNGGTRAASGPVPVPDRTPERLRTPTDVMRHRRAIIARQEAEKEASRIQQLEDRERRRRELESEPTQQRRSGRRRSGGEAQFDTQPQAPVEGSTQRRSGMRRSGGEPPADPQPAQPSTAVKDNLRDPTTVPAARQRGSSLDQGQPRPVQTQTQPQPRQASNTQASSSRRNRTEPARAANVDGGDYSQRAAAAERSRPQASTQPPQQAQPQATQTQSQSQQQQRTPFPHAFERWETLSSHWEGLTSYWIRRLQENSNELSREPLNQQMSRQITDLSAAGANLFHAVVELQRLRASSERKFQRWFFEHRTDQERFQDTQAQLERTLQTERQNREDALATANTAQAQSSKAEELVKEMRRELQISKEEARRAWEELGRREQVEREWTVSLQNGQPTIVGGVQVVPMTQGVPSRRTSTRDRPPTREGPYPGGPGPGSMSGQRPRDPAEYAGVYDSQALHGTASSPTETDPFSATDFNQPSYNPEEYYTQRTQPPTSSAAIAARTAVSPPASYPAVQQPGRFYQQPDPTIQPAVTEPSVSDTGRSYIPSTLSAASDEDAVEYEIDEHGNYRLDSQGRRIPYRGPRSDEGSDSQGDLRAEMERDRAHRERYGQPASSSTYQVPAPAPDVPTSSGRFDPPTSQVDYSGQAWGGGWEAITPRHRHPTRLSDVLEEDERSRATSPTRTSYVGSGAESQPASTRLVGIREEEHQPSIGRTGEDRGGNGRR